MKSTQTVKGEAEVPSAGRSEPMKCHAIYIGKFFHINKTFFQVRGFLLFFRPKLTGPAPGGYGK